MKECRFFGVLSGKDVATYFLDCKIDDPGDIIHLLMYDDVVLCLTNEREEAKYVIMHDRCFLVENMPEECYRIYRDKKFIVMIMENTYFYKTAYHIFGHNINGLKKSMWGNLMMVFSRIR